MKHEGHNVVTNIANGNEFKYCRDCKEEVSKENESSTLGSGEFTMENLDSSKLDNPVDKTRLSTLCSDYLIGLSVDKVKKTIILESIHALGSVDFDIIVESSPLSDMGILGISRDENSGGVFRYDVELF